MSGFAPGPRDVPASAVRHVIVAVPAACAVTNPYGVTEATEASLLSQLTLRFVAFVGYTLAVSCNVLPSVRFAVEWLSDIRVTLIEEANTLTS